MASGKHPSIRAPTTISTPEILALCERLEHRARYDGSAADLLLAAQCLRSMARSFDERDRLTLDLCVADAILA